MQEEKEIWKPVVGYEGYYEVSSFGNVRSVDRCIKYSNGFYRNHKGKNICPILKKGYQRVCLTKNNHKKEFLIHRLVAQAFIPNPRNYPCINHKDENKTNNTIENLEWCTHYYNDNYGSRNIRCLKTRIKNNGCRGVLKLSTDGKILKRYFPMSELRNDGYSRRNIQNCCNFKKISSYGFLWIFEEDTDKICLAVSNFKNKKPRNECKKIIQIDNNGNILNNFNSIKEASITLDISRSIISSRCTGKVSSLINGYTFKYAE